MRNANYDAVIIGGGPGGAATATLLARAGKRVLVLEREHFPRFKIGESLLPYNRRIFEEMGVLGKLEAGGFLRKYGAQFHLGIFRVCHCRSELGELVGHLRFDESLGVVYAECHERRDGELAQHGESFGVERGE